MKTKSRIQLSVLLAVAIQSVVTAGVAFGQQQPGSSKPEPYSVTSSVELGVRGISVEGNADKFRSDLNYQPGFRIFDSSFLLRSNGGGPFDTLLTTSSGWGGDPNGHLRLNVEKLNWYRFDGTVRQFDYFNSLSNLALNQHIANTDHKLGDFDLILLPQNDRIKFNIGYSFDRTSGQSLTTYDYSRDEFPVLTPVRTEGNDYRFGAEAALGPVDISFQQGFRFFKEDTSYLITDTQAGNNPTNFSVLNTFRRDIPIRGRVPYSRLSLHSLLAKKVDVTGRFIYQSATTRYTLYETLTGKDFSNNNIVLDQYIISGDTKRPNGIGDLGVTVFATDRLRVSDTVRVEAFHIDGGQRLNENLLRTRSTAGGVLTLPPVFVDSLSFRTISHRRAANTLEIDYEFHRRFTGHIGHRYTDRRIEVFTLDQTAGQTPAEGHLEPFDNRTNTVFWGFKARPLSEWSVYFDFERGETDNVFTRVDNYDFTNVRVRSRVTPIKALAINLSLVAKDNNNPTLIDQVTREPFGADVNSRVYSSSVDWAPNPRFSLSSGYTHTHVTSEAAIIFFLNNVRTQGLSRYFSRDDFAFLNTHVEIHPRASLYAAYRIHRDRGQGDRVASPTVFIGSYPQQFQSPEFRLAVKLHERLDWNVGYQYFDFKERFLNRQFYQAHLPYTSLRIYFNRNDK